LASTGELKTEVGCAAAMILSSVWVWSFMHGSSR
jgi:hypothetical protein